MKSMFSLVIAAMVNLLSDAKNVLPNGGKTEKYAVSRLWGIVYLINFITADCDCQGQYLPKISTPHSRIFGALSQGVEACTAGRRTVDLLR